MAKVSSRCLHYFSLPCWWSTELQQHGGSILGSVNLRKTFRWISDVWENAETQNLEKCLLYLSPIILKFLDFMHWIVFDLLFPCVTVKTIYMQTEGKMKTADKGKNADVRAVCQEYVSCYFHYRVLTAVRSPQSAVLSPEFTVFVLLWPLYQVPYWQDDACFESLCR